MIPPRDPEQHRIERLLRAGTRVIAVETVEEDRALATLEAIGEALGWTVHTWSAASGVDRCGTPTALVDLVHGLHASGPEVLWILLDPQDALLDPATRRTLRESAQRQRGPALVLVDPPTGRRAPSIRELVPEVTVVSLPPPTPAQLEVRLLEACAVLAESGFPEAPEQLSRVAERLTRRAHGLSASAFERLLAEAILDHGLDVEAIERFIVEHKALEIGTGGLLEPVEAVREDELGGLPGFKQWLRRRALALDPRARRAAIPLPRGVLLIGVQGCGKSLAARVCASVLDLPMLRLDPGRLFGGTVGESERNLRDALATAERMAPLVLWLDEVDKGLAGSERASSDAGTAARVVGALLTWLQERKHAVFVVATANRVDALPPELLRRGRLDELFFVDLPDAAQRREILRIHLETLPARQLGAAPPCADPWPAFASIAEAAQGFSGAELEAALVEARIDAFAEGRPLAAADLERAIAATVPLATSRAEDIAALRRWASERARPA